MVISFVLLIRFGAGSEYGREAREEARRRKYGGANRKKYNAEEQPWIMKTSEKGNRKLVLNLKLEIKLILLFYANLFRNKCSYIFMVDFY